MESIFAFANSFNQNLSNWDMGSNGTTNIFDIFAYTNSYNNGGVALNWDVSNITTMQGVFFRATAFNQDIGNWDTSSVTKMEYMFNDATSFNQDLTGWCVTNILTEPEFFSNSILIETNKPVWGTCPD